MFCSRCGTEVQDAAKFCPSCGLDLAATTPLAAVTTGGLDRTEVDQVRNALKDEYEILEELGRGGMAIVFKARDKNLDRDVAIKVLPGSLAFDAEFVERFQREARTSAKLEHPNIIPIYRVGKSGRVIFFVMKFLRGESLSERLDRQNMLPPAAIRQILCETAGALGYAHKNGIVHRDIKPDNIMFDESGFAIVTDFGIAKAATGTRLTGTGMSIGTPHYMSPEQARAQPLDGRSDIYSLGVVAYQCLVGSVPFDGEDSFAIGYKHIMEELPEPQLESADHRSLFEVIARMMAKAPDERFQTAEELVVALQGSGAVAGPTSDGALAAAATTVLPQHSPTSGGTQAPLASPTTPTTPIPGTSAGAGVSGAEPKKKRSGVLVGMMVFLLLGGGGAGGYWYFVLGAEWPPPFMKGGAVGTAPGRPAQIPAAAIDSSFLVSNRADSLAADSAAADSATADSAPPPVAPPVDYGILVVRGLPQGTQVKVDGKAIKGDSLNVDPGSHRIEAQKLGYKKFVTTQAVKKGEKVVLPVSLVKLQTQPKPSVKKVVEPPKPNVNVCLQDPPSGEYFTSGKCYDTPPAPTAIPIVPVPPNARTTPSPVQLMVKVSEEGKVLKIQQGRRVRASIATLAAVKFARSATYNPALKDGKPVVAWMRLTVQFRRP
ncbi:MAG: protein kinase [Gemmatimonadales bacterium]